MSTLSGRMIFINYNRPGTNPWLPSNNLYIHFLTLIFLSPIVSILVAKVVDLRMIYDVPIYIFTGMYFQEAVRQHSATCLLDWRS